MMNGLNQILGGLLAFCFSFIPDKSGMSSWRALFMTYGVLTVFWGAFVGWWMPDSPMRAHCFTENDKRLMVERVRRNRTGLQNRKFRKEQVWEVVKDPQGRPRDIHIVHSQPLTNATKSTPSPLSSFCSLFPPAASVPLTIS